MQSIQWRFICFACVMLFAQTALSQPALNFGLAASSLYTTPSESSTGFTFGVSKKYPLTNSFFILGSVMQTQKAAKLPRSVRVKDVWGNISEYDINLDLHYWEIMALASYYLPGQPHFIALHAGPSFATSFLDYSEINRTANSTQSDTYDYVLKDAGGSVLANSGLAANAGISFSTNKFSINLLYCCHLFSIQNVGPNRNLYLHEKMQDWKFYLAIYL